MSIQLLVDGTGKMQTCILGVSGSLLLSFSANRLSNATPDPYSTSKQSGGKSSSVCHVVANRKWDRKSLNANLSIWKGWRGDECDAEKVRNPVVGTGAGKIEQGKRMTGKQEVRIISCKRSRSNLKRWT
jgi:hypothetical protein